MDKLIQLLFYGFVALMFFRMIRGGGGCCGGHRNKPTQNDNHTRGNSCVDANNDKEKLDV